MTSAMRKRRGLRASRAAEAHGLRRPDIRWVFSDRRRAVGGAERLHLRCGYRFRRETFISVPSSQLQLMEEEERKEAEHLTPGRADAAPGESAPLCIQHPSCLVSVAMATECTPDHVDPAWSTPGALRKTENGSEPTLTSSRS